jgi:hypothetical protein
MSIPVVAALFLAIAAVGGATLAFLHFTGKTRPWALTILHGLLAATGLVLLAWPVLDGSALDLRSALIVLVAAALGGFFLVSFRLRGKPLPSAVVLVHGAVAATGLVLLLVNLL